jgi:hypothetical protein
MQIPLEELNRFKLGGRLGEGADSEAFAATDTETGQPVVIKRPHPTLVARSQHRAVERRIAKVIALREQLVDNLPHVAKVLAYTEPQSHDHYFGDALVEKYTITVEERAKGIPLVGSALDGIKRHPIGAPQNLFAIHPVAPHHRRGRFSIVRDILEVATAFDDAGALILDMRPQNIYFDPATAAITVIDIGGVTEANATNDSRTPLDLHDFYLELFKWYIPHSAPPDSSGYRQPIGMETIPMFSQNLDSMIRQHLEAHEGPWHSAAIEILRRIKVRGYPCINAFKDDFEPYVSLLEERYEILSQCEAVMQAWTDALHLLTAAYWRKFRFHPQDLAHYSLHPIQRC